MRTYPSILALIAALAVLSLVSGCGGSDDDGAGAEGTAAGDQAALGGEGTDLSGGETIAKAQFIKQGDAICEKTGAQIQAGLQPYFSQGIKGLGKPEVAEQIVEKVIAPELEAEIAAIRDIGQPSADANEAEAFLAALQEAIDDGRDDPSELVVGESPFGASERTAKSFGFKVCGGAF